MKSFWKTAAFVSCVILICAAVITWQFVKARGTERKLAEDASLSHTRAEQGDADAQFKLARMFYSGKGVPQDYTQAVRWYRKAADQGDAMAQDGLGFMYYQGKGVPQDYGEAFVWYRRAADQGYARAQYGLGYMYFQGKGVQRNYAEAARWYRKAAKQGDENSRRALAAMKIGFTTPIKVTLSIAFLGSILLLISSKGDIRNRQQRRVALAGLLGLLWVGLDVYGHSHFGILQALSAVNAFYFGKSLLSGISVAMFLSIVWPQGFKIVLTICAMPFVGFNVYAMMHYDLRQLTAWPRAFYSTNGLLMGIAIALAFLLSLAGEKSKGTQNGNDGAAPGTVAGTE